MITFVAQQLAANTNTNASGLNYLFEQEYDIIENHRIGNISEDMENSDTQRKSEIRKLLGFDDATMNRIKEHGLVIIFIVYMCTL